ncbi:MAG: ABC transporter substrate-binding protein [Candidatus Bipolaricaulia bacterium]
MNQILSRYLIIAVCALLLTSPTVFAREVHPPEEPLIVPIGETNELWETKDLVAGKPGGEVSYTTESFPKTFNNLIGKTRGTKDVTTMIMGSGLVAENPVNGRIVPGLAKSWSISENGRIYTFHLRQGLKFSDGRPLTAEDVVFTYEKLIFNPDVKTEMRSLLTVAGQLPEVERVDELTVKFKLPQPHGPFLRQVGTGIYPKHKLTGVTGEEFAETWNRKTAASDPEEIVGAGPFQLKKFVPGEELVLSRNPYYYKVDPNGTQLPYLDRYRIFKVEDNEVKFLKFKSGETDFLQAQISDMPYLLSQAKEEGWNLLKGEGRRSAPLNANFLTFNWNTEKEPLNEQFRKTDFRSAVSLAIDDKKIINKVFNGFGQLQYGPISRLSPYHNYRMKELLPENYDPGSARRILDKLGIEDSNGDGTRETPSGNSISFSIMVNEGNQVRTETAEIIALGLENIGLSVDVKRLQFDKYTSRLINGNYQAAIASVLANPREPSTLSDIYTSEGQLHLWNNGQKRTLADWERKLDRLFREGLQVGSFKERKKYYDQVQRICATELPVIYLPAESFLYATSSSVRNWKEFNRLGTFLDFAEYIWVES